MAARQAHTRDDKLTDFATVKTFRKLPGLAVLALPTTLSARSRLAAEL